MDVDEGNECVVRARGPNGWVEVHVCLDVNDKTTRRRAFDAALNALFAAVDTKSVKEVASEISYSQALHRRIEEVIGARKKITKRHTARKSRVSNARPK